MFDVFGQWGEVKCGWSICHMEGMAGKAVEAKASRTINALLTGLAFIQQATGIQQRFSKEQ